MYLSLIIIFILLLGIIVTGVQNSIPLDIKFFAWNLRITLLALIFYTAISGGAIVSLLTLPKLVSKSLKMRKMHKEIDELKKGVNDLGMQHGT